MLVVSVIKEEKVTNKPSAKAETEIGKSFFNDINMQPNRKPIAEKKDSLIYIDKIYALTQQNFIIIN